MKAVQKYLDKSDIRHDMERADLNENLNRIFDHYYQVKVTKK